MPITPSSSMTAADAIALRDQYAWKDLRQLLLMGLGFGVLGRGGVGLAGNMLHNLRRRRDREEPRSPAEITVELPKLAGVASAPASKPRPFLSEAPRPWWFVPSTVIGTPLALYGGWAGMGRLLRAVRKRNAKKEQERARQEFEQALSSEYQTKLGTQLDELAGAWAAGQLDDILTKRADSALSTVGSFLHGAPGLYWTLAALAGLGGIGAGWKLYGPGDEQKKIDAYREAQRRRQAVRPPSLVAKLKPAPTIAEEDDPDTQVELAALPKAAGARWDRIGKLLSPSVRAGLIGGAAGAGIAGLGGAAYLKSPMGQRAIARPMIDRMSQLLNDPRVQQRLYARLAQIIGRQFSAQHPLIGSLLG